jgi:hypothetical protein
MEDLPVALDDLISMIERPEREPLQCLTDAMILSGRIGELGEQLVDHFVNQAREGGASWAEIGRSLGVSKQAAQKRFTGGRRGSFEMSKGGLFSRFDESGRFVVQTAVKQAHGLRSTDINTLHLVMGLADPESGRASTAIADLAGSATAVSDAARDSLTGPKRSKTIKHLPFTDDCKKVLELALREAIRAESRSIGSEQILLGLLRTGGSDGARLLVEHDLSRDRVQAWLDDHPPTG